MKIRSLIVLIVLIIVISCLGFITYSSARNSTKIIFSSTNTEKVSVYSVAKTTGDGEPKLIKHLSSPTETLTLLKGEEYRVVYEAKDGYSDGEKNIRTDYTLKRVDIKPLLSDESLSKMFTQADLLEISSVFVATFPEDSQLYSLNPGKLLYDGTWYGATLTYRGDDVFNDDGLKIVFRKEAGKWEVKTTPPDITLSKYIYPEIPEEVLRATNKLPMTTPI